MANFEIPVVQFLAPNHCVVYMKIGAFLHSYNSVIAFKPVNDDRIQLGKDWKYSPTTGKYRNKFLDEKGDVTEKKLRSGEYIINKNF